MNTKDVIDVKGFDLMLDSDDPKFEPKYVELMDGSQAIYVENLFTSRTNMMRKFFLEATDGYKSNDKDLYGLTSEVKEVKRQLDDKEELVSCYELIVEPVYIHDGGRYTSKSFHIAMLEKAILDDIKIALDGMRNNVLEYIINNL